MPIHHLTATQEIGWALLNRLPDNNLQGMVLSYLPLESPEFKNHPALQNAHKILLEEVAEQKPNSLIGRTCKGCRGSSFNIPLTQVLNIKKEICQSLNLRLCFVSKEQCLARGVDRKFYTESNSDFLQLNEIDEKIHPLVEDRKANLSTSKQAEIIRYNLWSLN